MADDCLVAFRLITDCFVTSKRAKKLLTALYTDDNILCFNEGSGNGEFSCNEMGILNINLDNINLDDKNYNEDDHEIIIHIRLLA